MKKYFIFILLFLIVCCDVKKSYEEKDEIVTSDKYVTNCIFTIDSTIVEKNGSSIRLSNDNGNTWNNWLNVESVGKIKYLFVFKNGHLMICGDKKVYYSFDWKILNESNLVDLDGNQYILKADNNFSAAINDIRQYVSGSEVRCWGGYAKADDPNYVPRVWFTDDDGKTVKCVYDFNTTVASNMKKPINARHIHSVNYNPNDGSFWIQTGDFGDQCQWVRGIYHDKFEWTVVGVGTDYKTCNMSFIGEYVYYSWDVTPGGLCKVKYSDVSSLKSERTLLLSTGNDCSNFLIGNRGDIVVFITSNPGNMKPHFFYYSPDGSNFTLIECWLPDELKDCRCALRSISVVNAEGKISACIYDYNGKPIWSWSPMVWIDDIIRDNGFVNAFK